MQKNSYGRTLHLSISQHTYRDQLGMLERYLQSYLTDPEYCLQWTLITQFIHIQYPGGIESGLKPQRDLLTTLHCNAHFSIKAIKDILLSIWPKSDISLLLEDRYNILKALGWTNGATFNHQIQQLIGYKSNQPLCRATCTLF